MAAGQRKFKSNLEIFQAAALKTLAAVMTLRFVNPERFQVLYTTDNWATSMKVESHAVGYAGLFCGYCDGSGIAGMAS